MMGHGVHERHPVTLAQVRHDIDVDLGAVGGEDGVVVQSRELAEDRGDHRVGVEGGQIEETDRPCIVADEVWSPGSSLIVAEVTGGGHGTGNRKRRTIGR